MGSFCSPLFSLVLLLLFGISSGKVVASSSMDEVHVGVILDMGSWSGKIGNTCISMAVSDYYNQHGHHDTTRMLLHTRDAKGDPFLALSTAIRLMENYKLHALVIGAEVETEVKLLAELGWRAEVPIISFLPTGEYSPSFVKYPYFVQFNQDDTDQMKGIASLVEEFNRRDVILFYECTNNDQEIISSMISPFEDANVRIAHKIAIDASYGNKQIIELLYVVRALQNDIFIVHMTPYLSSLLFFNVKKLRMNRDGYVWIVTDKTMNYLHLMDPPLVESMQGMLGFKPYIPPSELLNNLTSRLKRHLIGENKNFGQIELNAYGLWAYDAIWALGMAVENAKFNVFNPEVLAGKKNLKGLETIRTSMSSSIILKELLLSRFKGISGEVELAGGKLISRGYEIVNLVDKGERRIGYWTPATGITKHTKFSNKENNSLSPEDLEAIIRSGGFETDTRKGWLLQTRNKTLKIGVPIARHKEMVKVERNPETNETVVTGFCVDVFQESIAGLPYEVKYEFIPFSRPIGKQDGYYNNLVDQVYYQKFDAVVGDITITVNRSLYVDFTLPFTEVGSAMVVKRTRSNDTWIFLKPLTTDLWLVTAIFFFWIGFVVWVIEHASNNEFQGSASQQIGNTLWFAFSTLVFSHREKLLSNSSKFVVIVWLFVVLILTSSYTAALSSMLTVQRIQSLSKETNIGFPNGNQNILNKVVSNLNFKGSKRLYGDFSEYADALTRSANKGGVSAIVDEIPYIKLFLSKYPAQYSMVHPKPDTGGFAFVFPIGSSFVRDISREIVRLREEDKLSMIEDKWFRSQEYDSPNDITDSDPSALSLGSFKGLFVISMATSFLAIFMYLISVHYEKWNRVMKITRACLEVLNKSTKYFLSHMMSN